MPISISALFTLALAVFVTTGTATPADIPSVGKVRVEVFRVSFADSAYAVSMTDINRANNDNLDFYRSMSRNALELEYHVYPEILHAPGKAADYEKSESTLEAWVLSQVSGLGMKKGVDYDLLIANFPWAAVGYGGITTRFGIFLNGWGGYMGSTQAHEIGHALGLNHAHGIYNSPDMFGSPGDFADVLDYGNFYDVMGRGSAPEAHFCVAQKKLLGWTDSVEVLDVVKSGVYRIYAHDNAVHKGRLLAIRVPSETKPYAYWFEYRTSQPEIRNGALGLFQGYFSSFTPSVADQLKDDLMLFDATPHSKADLISDYNDAAFTVGLGFKDKYGSATFKIVAIDNSVPGPDSWVDVQVTMPGGTSRLTPPRSVSHSATPAGFGYDLTGREWNQGMSSRAVLVRPPSESRPRSR